jgi:hypothetical protein
MKRITPVLALLLALAFTIVAQQPKKAPPKNKPRPAARVQSKPEPEPEATERTPVPKEGETTGTLTISGQPFHLRYAYAEKSEISDKKTHQSTDVTKLVLTDRLLSDRELEDLVGREWFSTSLREEGQEPRILTLFINEQGEAVKTQITEYEPDDKNPDTRHQVFTEERRRLKEFKLDGGRAIGKLDGDHTTPKGLKWSYTADFDTPVFDPGAEDKPVAESRNRVIGTLSMSGKTIKFTHVYAYNRKAIEAHWKKPNLIIVLTDREIADDEFDLDVEISKLAAAGQVHAIEVELNGASRENAISAMNVQGDMYYPGSPRGSVRDQSLMEYRGVKDAYQSERVSTVVDDGKVVEGIVYSSLLHGSNAQGRHIKWLYEAKFRATIRNTEQVGKALPVGGGVIGKAYLDYKRTEQGAPSDTIHFSQPRIVRGFLNGARATLTVHDGGAVYTVRMLLEGGKWKPASEKLTDFDIR